MRRLIVLPIVEVKAIAVDPLASESIATGTIASESISARIRSRVIDLVVVIKSIVIVKSFVVEAIVMLLDGIGRRQQFLEELLIKTQIGPVWHGIAGKVTRPD